jgi:hypothetical protein
MSAVTTQQLKSNADYLIENRRPQIIAIGDATDLFVLVPGPQMVPAAIWESAPLENKQVGIMTDEGWLKSHGQKKFSEIELQDAMDMVHRPIAIPSAEEWIKAENKLGDPKRKKVVEKLQGIVEASAQLQAQAR